MASINARDFYGEYHGHTVAHLSILQRDLGPRPRVFLAGDSSLDSKFWNVWCDETPRNGYENILSSEGCRRDVCFWLNQDLGPEYAAINCAVEESTLGARRAKLLPQDEFIRDNIGPQDVLVVSVGGNDVALRPTVSTAWNALKAVFFNSAESIRSKPEEAWGMPHFTELFRDATQAYVEKLVSKTKPSKIVVAMIYFPDENSAVASWSGRLLKLLDYDRRPERLQAFIAAAYECGTKQIAVDGVRVVPCPLFEVLDGKTSSQYVARVEPSEEGGAVMSKLIASCIMYS